MIIIGYPGVGKTTLSSDSSEFIDLESSCFYNNNERPADWYVYYCNLAHDLNKQGINVFVSSHEEVRRYLKKIYYLDDIICVHPALELKDQWIKKLEDRYKEYNSVKNYKAWINSAFYYSDNIIDMQNSGFPCLEIKEIPYNLEEMLSKV